jgi:hypothetical protein
MYCIRPVRLFLFCLLPAIGWAQERFTGFVQPQVAVNYSLGPAYSHNFSVQQRAFFYRDGASVLETRHIDLSHFSDFRWGPGRSLGLGILYRFREPFSDTGENELRLTQQVNLNQRANIVRTGHRFRTEQRILPSETLHRFRYRLALDGPLQGEKLDVGEAYWIGSAEGLLTVARGQKPLYSLRIGGMAGLMASTELKVQAGFEYRLVGIARFDQSVLFLLSSLVLTL